jgi:Zn-dependent protease
MSELELFLYLAPILVVSLVLHELAHAYVATGLGDPTPRREGRLTLNPIVHLDPLGTAMFVITYFLSNFVFGWAKPVHVEPGYFRRPKQAMALVGAAGPATNFLIALACVGVLVHVELGADVAGVLIRAYEVNLVLGIFNLIPIPPLDGSRIVGGLMGDDLYERWSAADQYGMLIIFGVIILFQEQFNEVMSSAFDESTRVMVNLVGG